MATSSSIAGNMMKSAGALLNSCMSGIAQLPFGQTFIRLLDRSLWIVEKTAQWSLPNHESVTEENGKSFKQMELVRPLPWIFFLPALVVLRLFRSSWNVVAFFTGYPRMEPSDIVRCLQKSRRQLRSIKTNAIKAMRQRKSSENLTTTPTAEQSENETPVPDSKRKYKEMSSDDKLSDESEEEETVITKIDRLALENSSDDQDFNPEDVSSSDSDSLSVGSDDIELSVDEIQIIKEDMLKDTNIEELAGRDTTDFVGYNVNFEGIKNEKAIGKITPRLQDFYVPSKGQDDVETAFYSPISSKSVSPEPVGPTIFNDHVIEAEKTIVQENGESKNKNHNDGALDSNALEKSNGHEIHQNQAPLKSMQKGKRSSYGSRKKK